MYGTASYIDELVRRAPQLQEIYDEHLRNHDTLLPHVFMGDVTRYVTTVAQCPENRASLDILLDCFEAGLRSGSDEIEELIVVSFVENLIGETSVLEALKSRMGSNLKKEVERICI